IQFKYLVPHFDVAHLGAGRLLVRLRGVWGNWDPLRIEGPDGRPTRHVPPPPFREGDLAEDEDLPEGPEGYGDIDEIGPLVYALAGRRLLFRNSAVPSLEEDDHLVENSVPGPIVFRAAEGRGEPQPAVTVRPPATATMDERPGAVEYTAVEPYTEGAVPF